jgi:hypothetical protein
MTMIEEKITNKVNNLIFTKDDCGGSKYAGRIAPR